MTPFYDFQWARDLGLRCDPPVKIPAYPAEHYYAVAAPPSMVTSLNLPCVRDFDSYSYMREWQGKFKMSSVKHINKLKPIVSSYQNS